MDYQVTFSSEARSDLRDTIDYISLDSPLASERFLILLVVKANKLCKHPWIGRIVPDFRHPHIREIIVGSYRVIYEVNECEQRVEILRFWHAARGTPEL